MKLSDRNEMFRTKFTQSLGKMSNSYNKLLGTTRTSFNSTRAGIQLPQLNRSLSKSTTGKLAALDSDAQDLNKKVHELRLQTRVNTFIRIGNPSIC